MDVKLFLVVGCMLTLVTSLYYDDCGGQGFIVKRVAVEDCSGTSCRIPVGNTKKITVYSVNEVTNFASLHSKAYISYMGHTWELSVTPYDICLHWGGCPLGESTTRTYSADVYFNSTLLRRPGFLTITAKYEKEENEIVAFCVRIPVELI